MERLEKQSSKKKTLLYLGENLVRLAKEHGLNISEVTEAAIRSHLYVNLSPEKCARFHQYLEDLKVQGDCYVLPTMIRTVRVENVGPIEHLKIVFSSRGLNVVLGPNGSGKTALIKALAYAFGFSKSDKPYHAVRNGKSVAEVEVETYGRIEIMYKRQDDSVTVHRNSSAVLLDEPLARANSKTDKYEFLKWVDREFVQAIVVSSDESLAEIPNSRILKLSARERQTDTQTDTDKRIKTIFTRIKVPKP